MVIARGAKIGEGRIMSPPWPTTAQLAALSGGPKKARKSIPPAALAANLAGPTG